MLVKDHICIPVDDNVRICSNDWRVYEDIY
jgi:hypothetical protein